jgi:hypothetical protein
VVRFVAALENTLLIVVPRVCIEAIATNAIKTMSRAYSVKSWPSSSFHNLLTVALICLSVQMAGALDERLATELELQRAGKAATVSKTEN